LINRQLPNRSRQQLADPPAPAAENAPIRLAPQALIVDVGRHMPGLAQSAGQRTRQILVNEEPQHSSECPYLLGCENICSVRERGEYVVAGDPVFVSYLGRREAGGLSDDDVDGHPGTADHRTARSDLGIDDDVRCKLGRGHDALQCSTARRPATSGHQPNRRENFCPRLRIG
jgi:hypothetical protein